MEKKVLLIDDEASLRRSISLGLLQKGYQTEPCENGMKGLETLETYKKNEVPLDCAIVDVLLPDIDGLKLLKVIKVNYPGLPVIIITGNGSEAVAAEAKAADAYLEKPFSMDDLAAIIEAVKPAITTTEIAVPPPSVSAQIQESLSVYALVSLDDGADFVDIYRKLYYHENVLYCDAVRGDHDLIFLLQAPTMDRINTLVEKEILPIQGVSDITLLGIDTPVFGENLVNIMGSIDKALGRDKGENDVAAIQTPKARVSSYVLLEVEKEKMEQVYPVLYFNDQVVSCDYTRGQFNIVLLMNGTSFSEIGNTVRSKLRTLDGVFRIKEYPIITLFEA
jgi:CheY-like chemotaxis protein